MSRIQQLSPHVINKIAAGEVIERPASVVKELLENSVDALSTRIDVDIEAGGSQLIRIADNGEGIHPEDFVLAVTSHATSKLGSADDLFKVQTLGFRGEALASIAEVSRFRVRSRVADESGAGSGEGAELDVNAGVAGQLKPCGCPVGTLIEVRELFHNTPVRRKFLKSDGTEFGHISEQFTRIALANPRLHLVLRHNGKMVYELPPADNLQDRIGLFFGNDLARQLISVESQHAGIRLWGYVGHPSQSKSTRRNQYLFLNGRWIQDKSLQHALGEAYRGLLMVGRYPICFLFLEIPPDQVDVNVHPTKAEVRFRDSQQIYRQLLSALRTKFLGMNLDSELRVQGGTSPTAANSFARPTASIGVGAGARGGGLTLQPFKPFPAVGRPAGFDAVDRGFSGFPSRSDSTTTDPLARFGERDARPATESPKPPSIGERSSQFEQFAPDQSPAAAWSPADVRESSESPHSVVANEVVSQPTDTDCRPPVAAPAGPGELEPPVAQSSVGISSLPIARPQVQPTSDVRAMQIHDAYIVLETPEGIQVVDQHALHERIMYEHLRTRVLAGGVEAQRLLLPETVELPPTEAALVAEHAELLSQLGLNVEGFGGNTVIVTSYPAMMRRTTAAQIVREVAEQIAATGQNPSRRDLLDSLLHMMSCKAAIKAGQRLTAEEIDSLLAQRHLIDDAHHCPHGRPTALVLSRTELDRQFGRLG